MKLKKVIIVAEAGVNHNGDLKKALSLVDVAADSGADFVKFQTFKAEKLVSPNAIKANYQKKIFESEDIFQFSMLKKLELSSDWHKYIIEHCKKKKIGFLSTAFDIDSLDFINKLGTQIFKIPSGEITNKPYLQRVGSFGKKIYLSTGMSEINEIKSALEILIQSGTEKKNIVVLHCNTEYPTPMEDVNLKAMNHISDELKVDVGYSDHTLGIEIPIAAVAMGAKVIEKHFTLNRKLNGPDHIASIEPKELKMMINSIRNVEIALSGSGLKSISNSEIKNKDIVRKSLHYSSELKAGKKIKSRDLICLRPGDGVSSMEIEKFIGRKLKLDVKKFQKLKKVDFE